LLLETFGMSLRGEQCPAHTLFSIIIVPLFNGNSLTVSRSSGFYFFNYGHCTCATAEQLWKRNDEMQLTEKHVL
jgi:hypothetical protein